MSDTPEISQATLDNAQNLVGLMREMYNLSESISNNMASSFSPTERMVETAQNLTQEIDSTNNSLNNTQNMLNSLNDKLSEAEEHGETLGESYNNQLKILQSINQATGEIGESLGANNTLTSMGTKLLKISTKISNKLNNTTSIRAALMEDYNNKLKKARDIRRSTRDFLQSEQGLELGFLQRVGVRITALGQTTSAVLDAITSHPVIKVISLIIKGLMKVYEYGKRVVQIMAFLAKGAFTAVKKLGELMIGIPLKISEMAAEIGGKARKETREVFDQMAQEIKDKLNLGSSVGQAFANSVEEGKKKLQEFYDLNDRSARIFGLGSEGFKNMMNESQQIIMDLGPQLSFFGQQLGKSKDSRTNLVMIQKALGATGQDMANIGILARSTGRGFMDLGIEIQQTIEKSSKKFNQDSKQIGTTVFNLRNDFIEFGAMTTEAISESVAELTQMGVQAEDIAAVFKKFDTFESAAQSAAMLSQTFGMNVDALRLIQAESPSEIFEELTTAMYNTGRSFADLNRHERALMAQHTGLSGKTLEMVMNYTEMGMTYEEAMAKAEEQDPVNKQAKALEKMTDAIKELNKTLSFKSPFSAFLNGIKTTIYANSDLRKSVEGLSQSYESFYTDGLKFGGTKILQEATKPMDGIIKKIQGILGGEGLKSLLKGTITNISKFISSITSKEFSKTEKTARKAIRDMFDFRNLSKSGELVNDLLKTGGEIIGWIVKGTVIFVDEMSKILGEYIDQIAESFGPKAGDPRQTKFGKLLNEYFGIDVVSFGDIFDTMIKNIGKLFVKLPKLLEPIASIVQPYFETIAEFFVDKISKLLTAIFRPLMTELVASLKDALPAPLQWIFGSGDKYRTGVLNEDRMRELSEIQDKQFEGKTAAEREEKKQKAIAAVRKKYEEKNIALQRQIQQNNAASSYGFGDGAMDAVTGYYLLKGGWKGVKGVKALPGKLKTAGQWAKNVPGRVSNWMKGVPKVPATPTPPTPPPVPKIPTPSPSTAGNVAKGGRFGRFAASTTARLGRFARSPWGAAALAAILAGGGIYYAMSGDDEEEKESPELKKLKENLASSTATDPNSQMQLQAQLITETSRMRSQENAKLVSKLNEIKNAINSQTFTSNINLEVDGESIGRAAMKHMTSEKTMSKRLKIGSFENPALSEESRYS